MATMQRQVFRVQPKGGPEDYKTYGLMRPKATHWRTATCQEVNCANHARGWRMTLDLSTALGQRQGRYIRDHSGRSYVNVGQEGVLVTLEFAAGQKCFAEHRVPLERMPLFVVKGGDYRGNPRGIQTQRRSAQGWIDDFGEHQLRLKETVERG
jgi:hypothetical protein